MQRAKHIILTAQIFALALHTAVLLTMRHSDVMGWLVALWALSATGNMIIPLYVLPRLGYERAENWRMAFNIASHLPIPLLCNWNIPSWLFVPFLTALSTTPPALYVLPRVLSLLLSFSVAAALTGGRWQDTLVFTSLSLFFHFVLVAYLEVTSNFLRERDRALRELHAAQQQSIAQEKMASVGQLAAGVAHEINNPMCFVTANVQALLEDLRDLPELPSLLAEYRDEILPETIDGIKRVNSIVDDLRRFARGEPDRFQPFDLTSEISAAVRMARTQMKPGQALDLDVPPALAITGSARQICQVVLNLIVNSLQALPERGHVHVVATEQPDCIEVVISDTGAGMTEETKRRLFEPFFTTKARQGLGLGLSVVHSIVTAHGGSIEVESTLGRGSRFRMKLPRQSAVASASG
jgi:signal transduction histidine kinase